ncbi:hypothetical protein [Prauserella halophila]|nr:hypothetical protein [Prauserella halophila]MCP2236623.1 hypothetical protein [Prauserella halophila]
MGVFDDPLILDKAKAYVGGLFSAGSMPIEQIVRAMRQGESGKWQGTADEADTLTKDVTEGDDASVMRSTKMMQAMESSWTGEGAEAAAGTIRRGMKAAQATADVYQKNARFHADNSHSFDGSKNQFPDIPKDAPEKDFFDHVTPWDTDTEGQINQRNAKIEQAKQVYQGYDSTVSDSAMNVDASFDELGGIDGDFSGIERDKSSSVADAGTGVTSIDEPGSGGSVQPGGPQVRPGGSQVQPGGSQIPSGGPTPVPGGPTPGNPTSNVPGPAPDDTTSSSGYTPPDFQRPAAAAPGYNTPGFNSGSGFGPGGSTNTPGFGPVGTGGGFGPTGGGSSSAGGGRFSTPGMGGAAGGYSSGGAGAAGGAAGAAGGAAGAGRATGAAPFGPAGSGGAAAGGPAAAGGSGAASGGRGGMPMGGAGGGGRGGQGGDDEDHQRKYIADTDHAFSLTEGEEVLRDPVTGHVVTPPTIGE